MELYMRDCDKFPYVSMRDVIDKILLDDKLYQKIGIYINHILNTEVLPSDPSTDEISKAISSIADKVSATVNQSVDNLLTEKGIDPNFDFEKRCKNIITAVIDKYFAEPDITVFIDGGSMKFICDECKGYITYTANIRKDKDGRYIIGNVSREEPYEFISHVYAEDVIYDIVMDCDEGANVTFNNDIINFDFREYYPSADKKKEYRPF